MIKELMVGEGEATPEVENLYSQVKDWTPEKLLHRIGGSEIAIFAFGGGWGLEPLSKDKDFSTNLSNVVRHLEGNGCGVSLIDDVRQETARQILSMGETALSKHAAQVITGVMEERGDLQVLLIGLSNGANFLEKISAGMEDKHKDRLWALEFGRPTWPWVKTQLTGQMGKTREIHGPDDFLREWSLPSLKKALGTMNFPPRIEFVHGRPRARFDIPGHIYDWETIGEETKGFLKGLIEKVKER